MMGDVSCRLVVVLFLSLLGLCPAAAQSGEWAIGASAAGGLFVGTEILDGGLGIDAVVSKRMGPHFLARADGMLVLLNAHVTPGERADNRIFILSVGPEVEAGRGPLSAYLRGAAGVAANLQVRSGSALDERTTYAAAFGAGAGVRVKVAQRVQLDGGVDVLKIGELDFARTAVSSLMLIEDSALLRARAGVRFALR